MQLTNILVAALAAGSSTAASVSARAARVARQAPCPRIGASDPNFGVADLASGVVATKTLTFDVAPFAAGPCSLIGSFGAGFPVDLGGADFSRLDVHNAATGALVGSFAPLKVENDRVVEDTEVTINSFVCEPVMSFRFSIANDADADVDINVTFTADATNGFFIQKGDQCPQ
ncbi:hypothetical protein CkaCkLH20_00239 [Colletotrichum karsti]|uniref:Uncharacterized protein n=1 Tax=Colletotrichum karsti TaxID=1095194 RepID=A0A9P6IEV4_9PEZI|nr:uncharacterized protein CkaCkLH20_00239 [Colletotrichum karsti]KAF9882203.1 hypothetical protein CkaCkLH20_00239 [Colletotrichum karsti]